MENGTIVVKIGTSSLTHENGKLNIRRIELLVRVLSDIMNEGRQVVLVSSGAIGVGMGRLTLTERPPEIRRVQALAAIGQGQLISIYDKFFSEYGRACAQILLTRDVLEDEVRHRNAVNVFQSLFEYGIIPIVNENDVISTEEIEFGDNDTLSAYVATLVNADLLVILSDIDGLYDKDPQGDEGAKLISEVSDITEDILTYAGGAGSRRGTGGMRTKLKAAQIATGAGVNTVIANGRDPAVLYEILSGVSVGTLFRHRR